MENATNMEAEHIAKSIKLNDRIGKYQAKNCALTTMKDYKVKLRSSHPCRLINSCKIQLSKVSKNFAEKVNVILTESLGNKSTEKYGHCIRLVHIYRRSWFDWFTSSLKLVWLVHIYRRRIKLYICRNIVESYSFIITNVLNSTIKFAEHHTTTTKKDLKIINHYRKSPVYHSNEP